MGRFSVRGKGLIEPSNSRPLFMKRPPDLGKQPFEDAKEAASSSSSSGQAAVMNDGHGEASQDTLVTFDGKNYVSEPWPEWLEKPPRDADDKPLFYGLNEKFVDDEGCSTPSSVSEATCNAISTAKLLPDASMAMAEELESVSVCVCLSNCNLCLNTMEDNRPSDAEIGTESSELSSSSLETDDEAECLVFSHC